jgi:Flp pilus assembly protein TadG
MTSTVRALLRRGSAYRRNERGSAAVEFAIWLAALAVPTFEGVDVGFYAFQSLQVGQAAQMGSQYAWSACSTSSQWPATKNCGATGATLNTAIQNGERSTSLGNKVTMTSGTEYLYCVNASGALVDVATQDGVIATSGGDVNTSGSDTAAAGPATCSSVVTGSTNTPGDYITVTVTYTYHPVFKGLSVLSLLGGSNPVITRTAYTRLN